MAGVGVELTALSADFWQAGKHVGPEVGLEVVVWTSGSSVCR